MKAEIVLNTCFGGFSLSDEAAAVAGIGLVWLCDKDVPEGERVVTTAHISDYYAQPANRFDKTLIEVVKKMGASASAGPSAYLEVVSVDCGRKFIIHSHDGREQIKYLEDLAVLEAPIPAERLLEDGRS